MIVGMSVKWVCARVKYVLSYQYVKYIHKTNTIVFTIFSTIKRDESISLPQLLVDWARLAILFILRLMLTESTVYQLKKKAKFRENIVSEMELSLHGGRRNCAYNSVGFVAIYDNLLPFKQNHLWWYSGEAPRAKKQTQECGPSSVFNSEVISWLYWQRIKCEMNTKYSACFPADACVHFTVATGVASNANVVLECTPNGYMRKKTRKANIKYELACNMDKCMHIVINILECKLCKR